LAEATEGNKNYSETEEEEEEEEEKEENNKSTSSSRSSKRGRSAQSNSSDSSDNEAEEPTVVKKTKSVPKTTPKVSTNKGKRVVEEPESSDEEVQTLSRRKSGRGRR